MARPSSCEHLTLLTVASLSKQSADTGRLMIYEYLRAIQAPTANVGITCIYCDSQQQHLQTAQNLLASLWSVLRARNPDNPPEHIENLYRRHKQWGTKPDIAQVQCVVQLMLDEFEKTYILIDGLDECSDATRLEFMGSIEALMARSEDGTAKIHVFVTSRLEHAMLNGIPVRIQATKKEITSMVTSRIGNPATFRPTVKLKVSKNQGLQKEIVNKIVEKRMRCS